MRLPEQVHEACGTRNLGTQESGDASLISARTRNPPPLWPDNLVLMRPRIPLRMLRSPNDPLTVDVISLSGGNTESEDPINPLLAEVLTCALPRQVELSGPR